MAIDASTTGHDVSSGALAKAPTLTVAKSPNRRPRDRWSLNQDPRRLTTLISYPN
jgi:hypothetical protein